MERPMATLGFSFFLSLMLASFLELKMTVVLAALCFAAFIAGLFIGSVRQSRRIMTALLAAVAAFSMYSGYEMLQYRPLQHLDGHTATLRVQTLDWVDSDRVTVRVTDGGLPKGTRLSLYLSDTELYPSPYDSLEGQFRLSKVPNYQDGQLQRYFKSDQIYLYAFPEEYGGENITLTSPEKKPLLYTILQSRRAARNTVMSQPEMNDVSALMTGIAFGFKEDISSDIKYNFRTVGVSHLLAVSGLHVALLSQALLTFLLFLRVPRRAALPLVGASVLYFMALTGFEPSVLRAGIMCLIFLGGQMIGREPDSLNSLGLSVLAITVVNPFAVNDTGLLLSFAATFGILVIFPHIRRATTLRLLERDGILKLLAKPVDALAITIAATIPTLPVILFVFGQISLASPLANLLMVFPASVVMVATCIAVPLYAVPPLRFLSSAAFFAGKQVARYLFFAGDWLANLPHASLWSRQTFLYLLIPAAILLIYLGRRWLGRHGMRVAALWSVIALMCGLLTYGMLMRGVTRITLVSAGNATALLLERNGRAGVILTGGEDAASSAVNGLERSGVRSADVLIFPCLDDECAYQPMIFTDKIRVKSIVTGSEGKYSDTVNALPAQKRFSLADGALKFWNDCFVKLDNGWLTVTVGKTRLLVCPYGANASELPPALRNTNLAVFTGTPPRHVSVIAAQAGVLNCMEECLAENVKAFPRGTYPLYDTAEQNVTILTRGKGDLTYKGKDT